MAIKSAIKSWTTPGDTKPVNPSKQPKGTIFGAYAKPAKMMKKVPMKTKKKMSTALSRNYS